MNATCKEDCLFSPHCFTVGANLEGTEMGFEIAAKRDYVTGIKAIVRADGQIT